MLETVQKTIEQFHMLETGDKVVLGVSGGADSMSLFMVLLELAEIMDLQLHVVHVNHLLRKEAEEEEAYVSEICGQYHVDCNVFRKNIAEYAEELGCSVEEAGRKFRYECFEQVCRQKGCQKIAVAHHENDRAETLLFHVARGTGLRGIGSIPAVRGKIIRPLLYISRKEIEQYLEMRQVRYYNDASNFSEDYSRNVIRHQVLPQMEKVNQQAVRHMAELAETAQEYWSYVEQQAELAEIECVCEKEQGIEWKEQAARKYPKLVQRHMVYRMLTKVSGSSKDWEQLHVEQILELLEKNVGKMVILPYQMEAIRTYEGIRLRRQVQQEERKKTWSLTEPEQPVPVIIDGITYMQGIGQLECRVRQWDANCEISKKQYTKMLDYDKIKGTLCIRKPISGDYFIINRQGERKKLSRFFIDNKIPREQREEILVLAAGQQVCWIIGMRISEELRVSAETKQVLEVTFQYYKEYEGEQNG